MAGDSEVTKKKILDNACKLFAQNGYTATRVADISTKCDISKALIYYNFPSKQSILDAIMERFKENIKTMFTEVFHNVDSEDAMYWTNEEMKAGMKVFMTHKDEFTILISEALKSNNKDISLFDFWEEINESIRKDVLAHRGYDLDKDKLSTSLCDYFFVLVPTIFFSIMRSAWAKKKKVNQDIVDDEFNRQLNIIYKNYYTREKA
ncbi:TetR/AcrR family transcriptional regulator [Spirochaeta cellobiosiphila]|uniref:TetR/AcrR family transcriptional regulator n=1 Tax=Spirochaeta cellobiosiphila TaxID=504483 RepID=UPI00042845DE|nr:TetR/AcrR family transcriptional regulator [Spirochaeta cellobiosiphila]